MSVRNKFMRVHRLWKLVRAHTRTAEREHWRAVYWEDSVQVRELTLYVF